MSQNHYDVIIIGGRCAGSSLALRLAGQRLKILLLDRATFPSLPQVPSSPIFHPGTMRLLDELGIEETEYALPGSKIERYILDFVNYFHAEIPTSRMNLDRNYTYGIDRNHFDNMMWKRVSAVENVSARDGFSVTRIVQDESGKASAVIGQTKDGETVSYTGDLIVGADGRFSFAAGQLGAKVIEERNEFTTAGYQAEWENVDDYAPDMPSAVTIYDTARGFAVLVIPIAERKYIICNYMRVEFAKSGREGHEAAYLKGLQRMPHLWKRMENARRVGEVVGVRRIGNGYREAYGKNWALVGDAVHYKDPVDGQGIYDALIETKFLAQSIIDWKFNGMTWDSAAARYQQQMMEATHPMFLQTVARIKQMMHTDAPEFLIKTYLRWLLTNPDYQTQFLRYLSRAIDPAEFSVEPSISPKVLVSGIAKDLRKRFRAS